MTEQTGVHLDTHTCTEMHKCKNAHLAGEPHTFYFSPGERSDRTRGEEKGRRGRRQERGERWGEQGEDERAMSVPTLLTTEQLK